MGASADQIEREIRETRERLDENLGVLESRAVSNAVRYGRIAAIALVVTGAGVAGFLIYRRLRRPGLRQRIEGLSRARGGDRDSRERAVPLGHGDGERKEKPGTWAGAEHPPQGRAHPDRDFLDCGPQEDLPRLGRQRKAQARCLRLTRCGRGSVVSWSVHSRPFRFA